LLNNGNCRIPPSSSGAIDPKRKLLISFGDYGIGGNHAYAVFKVDISGPPYTCTDVTTAVANSNTCGPISANGDFPTGPINTAFPGIAYDPILDRMVLWPGHDTTVYLFNPDKNTCTTQTLGTVVPAPVNRRANDGTQKNGVMGRFRYFPALDVFAAVPDPNSDAYVLRLDNSGAASTVTLNVVVNGAGTGTVASSDRSPTPERRAAWHRRISRLGQ
jgi:hypothetical protein